MIRFNADGSFSLDYSGPIGRPVKPWVQWNHVDGPLLHLCDGSLHWLTWKERFLIWIGRITVESLDPMWSEDYE